MMTLDQYLSNNWKYIYINNEKTNYIVNEYGDVINTKTNKHMAQSLDKDGYVIIGLSHNKKQHMCKQHRLVGEAFIPNPYNKPQINHKDGNKRNNHYSNLEWVTSSENIKHALNTGLKIPKTGIEANGAKYTDDQIIKACRLIDSGKYSDYEIDRICGFGRGYTYCIRKKITRKNVIDKYYKEKGSTTIENKDNGMYNIRINL